MRFKILAGCVVDWLFFVLQRVA